jgi:hypothetical protein
MERIKKLIFILIRVNLFYPLYPCSYSVAK